MTEDKEERKRVASVEVLEKNVKSVQQFTIETRKLLRKMQDENTGYLNKVITLEEKINILETQIQTLQVKVFSGGATG